jgi:hypothetical protein
VSWASIILALTPHLQALLVFSVDPRPKVRRAAQSGACDVTQAAASASFLAATASSASAGTGVCVVIGKVNNRHTQNTTKNSIFIFHKTMTRQVLCFRVEYRR